MEYDVNKTEFVKTRKGKYVILMREHIFQIHIDRIVHNEIFLKDIFSLCSNILCEMFSLLYCFTCAELKCLPVPHIDVFTSKT